MRILETRSSLVSPARPELVPNEKPFPRVDVAKELGCHARAEAQLLFACARTSVDSKTRDRIATLLAENLDWEFVLQKAHQNCVTPLLYWSLSTQNSSLIPDAVMKRLRLFFSTHVRRNLHQTAEMITLVRLFEQVNIPALPFKGPTLAARAYGNISLRQFNDLDILVRKSDLPKAIRLLVGRGYARAFAGPPLPDLTSADLRRKDLGLISRDGSVRVELHWRLSGTHFGFPFDLDELWERLSIVELAGSSIRSLTANDLLIYLCVHGSRHGWERLQWVCDVAEHIRHNPDSNWSLVLKRARNVGCERSVRLGLFLASRLLDAELPTWLQRQLDQDVELKIVEANVCEWLFRQPEDSLTLSDWYTYHLRVKERSRDKLRLHMHYAVRYLRLALRPNRRDHALVSLPTPFSFLYYLLRPMRLINERCFRRRRV